MQPTSPEMMFLTLNTALIGEKVNKSQSGKAKIQFFLWKQCHLVTNLTIEEILTFLEY